MTLTVNVQEAKTRLSELLRIAADGREVLIARAGRPVARLESLEHHGRDFSRPVFPGIGPIDEALLTEPMSEEELLLWEEGHENDPMREFWP